MPTSFEGLAAFLEVGRRESFTAAAALGVSPTAVSQQIERLEQSGADGRSPSCLRG